MDRLILEQLKKVYHARSMGMQFDLFLTDARSKEWNLFQHNLITMAKDIHDEMYLHHRNLGFLNEPDVSLETETRDGHVVYKFLSEVGKVEFYFSFYPSILRIEYSRIELTCYKEVYTLC